jgi:hypothetical protein
MGLLDDAIREHMELKRLRGADPSEVARQEQDVLGRVPRRGDPEEQDEDAPEPSHPARGADFANVGQETAELDMRTVLDEQHEAADRAGQIDSAGLGGSPSEEAEPAGTPDEESEPVEDVLEETPEFLRDTPEQERLWFEQQPPRDFDFDK